MLAKECGAMRSRSRESCQSTGTYLDTDNSARPLEPIAIFADRPWRAMHFHIVGIDKNRKCRHVLDAAHGVSFQVRKKHVAVPRNLFGRTLPSGEARDIQPVFEHLRGSCGENLEIGVEISKAVLAVDLLSVGHVVTA